MVWSRSCWPRQSTTTIMILHHGLPTMDNLRSRGLCLVNHCSLCLKEEKSHTRLFIDCSFSLEVWQILLAGFGYARKPRSLRFELRWIVMKRRWKVLFVKLTCTFCAMLYEIWKERNTRIFKEIQMDVQTVSSLIRDLVEVCCNGLS